MISQNSKDKLIRNIPRIKIINPEENSINTIKYTNYGELWKYNDKENKFYKSMFYQRSANFDQLSSDNKVIEAINLRAQFFRINMDNSIPKADKNGLSFGYSITLIQNDTKIRRTYYHNDKDVLKKWDDTMKRYCLLTNFDQYYESIKKIAYGSSSSVFLVKDKKYSKFYAAKAIDFTKRSLGEIFDEIIANQAFKHPFIPEYYGAFFEKNQAILIFEYIQGSTLLDYLNIHGKLPEKQAALIIENLLKTLEYVHNSGFIHRDIKVSNILIIENGSNLNMKLIDFGLTKKTKNIDLLNICGTPGFMAPEVINRKPYTSKVDIFGLGITLFTILTGNLPFNSSDQKNLLSQNSKHLEMFKNPLWKMISKYAQNLIENMTALNPEFRYSVSECLTSNWIIMYGSLHLSSARSAPTYLSEKKLAKSSFSMPIKSLNPFEFKYNATNYSETDESTTIQKVIQEYPTFQEIVSTCLIPQVKLFDSKNSHINNSSSNFKVYNSIHETDIYDLDDDSESIGSKLDFICRFLPKGKPN